MPYIGGILLLVFAATWLRTNNVRRALGVTVGVTIAGAVALMILGAYGIMRH